jgi:hypothetical protein
MLYLFDSKVKDNPAHLLWASFPYLYYLRASKAPPANESIWPTEVAVLSVISPELSHDNLVGNQHGQAASEAYAEAINPKTNKERRIEIGHQLLKYCELDTLATVKIWEFFRGA